VTGTTLNDALWELGISVESADSDSLIMTISPIDEPVWIVAMGQLLADLINKHRGEARKPTPIATWQVRPEVAMTPRDAMFAPRRRIAMADAVGEVSAEQFCPYPPGVPLIGPGELVTEQLVEAVRIAGTLGRVAYCSDPTLATIEIVDNP
jgi:lysine decarboxylase